MSRKKEKEKEVKWKSWGVYYLDGKKHQKDPWVCPFCDYRLSIKLQESFIPFLVGFSDEYYFGFFECPKCFEVFFRHLSKVELDLIEYFMEDEPDFFKILDTRKELLKIIKKRKKQNP